MKTSGSRVLLVDDEREWYDRVSRLLHEEVRCNVDWAQSANECRDKVEQYHHDVVIMDLDLKAEGNPQTGLDLTTALTGDYFIEQDRYTVVVILSYHGQPEFRIKGYTAGSINFFAKPTTPEGFKLFRVEFPRLIESLLYHVEIIRKLECRLSDPNPDEITKGNVRLGSDYIYVSEKRVELRAYLLPILRALIESRYPVPSAVLMRQVGITRENTLHSYLSTLRKQTGLQIRGNNRGYYIDLENE